VGSGDGGETVDLFVDLDALSDLRSRLLAIQESLATLTGHPAGIDAELLGGAEVESAVNTFADRWRGARDQIDKNMSSADDALSAAIEGYQLVESKLIDAVQEPGEAPAKQ
jgi:hypothetical protein